MSQAAMLAFQESDSSTAIGRIPRNGHLFDNCRWQIPGAVNSAKSRVYVYTFFPNVAITISIITKLTNSDNIMEVVLVENMNNNSNK